MAAEVGVDAEGTETAIKGAAIRANPEPFPKGPHFLGESTVVELAITSMEQGGSTCKYDRQWKLLSFCIPLRIYGSGYPTAYGTSPYERGFPYRFWPITWGNNSHTSTSSDNSVILITNTEVSDPSEPLHNILTEFLVVW